jgi:6-phosphogluconolactonase/glucosamine-6-phosphate isomerase/deaminase
MKSTYSDNPIKASAEHLSSAIKKHLTDGEHVLWFLSGGSGIEVVLETDRLLAGADLTNLFVTLSDERYGPVGHPDENWQQLIDGGLKLDGATIYRPLIGEERSKTTNEFGAWIMQAMSKTNYKVGLFGIGSDGHTAGIKPHSSAVEASAWTDSFTGEDFERITVTPFAIAQLDEAILQASGADKVPTLKKLLYETIDIADQPAQILKTVQNCTLYTDNKEV